MIVEDVFDIFYILVIVKYFLQACFLSQDFSGNNREFTAKCINPKKCSKYSDDEDASCCFGNLCNDVSLLSSSAKQGNLFILSSDWYQGYNSFLKKD